MVAEVAEVVAEAEVEAAEAVEAAQSDTPSHWTRKTPCQGVVKYLTFYQVKSQTSRYPT